jgi:hypothetical protein
MHACIKSSVIIVIVVIIAIDMDSTQHCFHASIIALHWFLSASIAGHPGV